MLKILLKSRLLAIADQFSGQSKGKKAATITSHITLIVLGLLLMVGAAVGVNALLGGTVAALAPQGLTWGFYAAAGGLSLIASLFLTMFYAQGVVFEAKDNEMLLSMPIPPSAILASRIGSVYLMNLIAPVVIMFATGYTVAVRTGGISVLSVVFLVLCTLLLTLLTATITCLLAWLVSIITRRTRKKTLVQLLLSLAAMGLLYFVTSNINRDLLASIKDNAVSIADFFRSKLYPLYVMGQAIAESGWLQLLIFAACCIVPFVLVYFLLSKSFIRIVTARSTAAKLKYEATSLKSSSLVWAMTKKDLTRFFNSSPYMMNAGIGLLYTLGWTIFNVFSGNSVIKGLFEQGTTVPDAGPYMILVSAYTLSFFAGLTTISGCSVSVEGKNLWILKSLPVRAKGILIGKFLSHLVLAAPVSIICSILYLLSMPSPDVIGIAAIFLMPLAANVLCALTGVISNLFFGKLNYPSIAKAAKSSASSLIPMLATTVLVVGTGAVYLFFLRETVSVRIFTVAVILFLLAVDAGLYFFLGSSAVQKRWEALGNS